MSVPTQDDDREDPTRATIIDAIENRELSRRDAFKVAGAGALAAAGLLDVPCISTVVPWEAWYFGRQADPKKPKPFKYTFHFCFGVQQFFLAYTHLWPQVKTNKKVGVLWPNDADGNAIRASLGPLLKKAGY